MIGNQIEVGHEVLANLKIANPQSKTKCSKNNNGKRDKEIALVTFGALADAQLLLTTHSVFSMPGFPSPG